jgi:hypothetical protein
MYSSTQNHSLDTVHRGTNAPEARTAGVPEFLLTAFCGKVCVASNPSSSKRSADAHARAAKYSFYAPATAWRLLAQYLSTSRLLIKIRSNRRLAVVQPTKL